ncbi:ABC transporter permease [Dongia sedimenti]|uniref:ABC transporter permease n=1 Tax=Dongia sedimenti TaxID=3064282 RepID=A0ABU0YGK6_9PROT|nr:ABC transporter permease [Rhodospirillaceae bacterium R-7]
MYRFRFVLFRPLQLVPVLLGISAITFVLVRSIPGDPARILLGSRATPETIAQIRAQFGLDEPLWLQFVYFLKNLVHGDMGRSILYKSEVLGIVTDRIEPTAVLVAGSVLLAVVFAVSLSALAATHKGRATDHLVRMFSTAGLGFPAFWLGIMLMMVFSVRLELFPVSGYGDTPLDRLHHMLLPCLTVALALSAVLTRNLRASMIAQMASDYATAARARGLPDRAIFWRHVLPNSIVPTVNLLAINIGWLIGGTVVIESVFSIPGMGQLLVRAIFSRDYMVVQAVAMVFACASVLVNFAADIATVAIDPRVKL